MLKLTLKLFFVGCLVVRIASADTVIEDWKPEIFRPECPIPLARVGGKGIKIAFTGKETSRQYAKKVKDIHPGDTLVLPDGKPIKVESILGSHDVSLVLKADDGTVKKIPLNRTSEVLQNFNSVPEAYKRLSNAGVDVVELHENLSKDGQITSVKYEPFQFTLSDYLNGVSLEGKPLKLSKKEKKELEDKLIQFAKTTWPFENIGDFRAGNIGWNGKKWLLFDYAEGDSLIKKYGAQQNTFSPAHGDDEMGPFVQKRIPDRLYERVEKAIDGERERQKEKRPLLFRPTPSIGDRPGHWGRYLIKESESRDGLEGKEFSTKPGNIQTDYWDHSKDISPQKGIQSKPLNFTIGKFKKYSDGYFIYDVQLQDGTKARLLLLENDVKSAKDHFKLIKSYQKGKKDSTELMQFGSDFLILRH